MPAWHLGASIRLYPLRSSAIGTSDILGTVWRGSTSGPCRSERGEKVTGMTIQGPSDGRTLRPFWRPNASTARSYRGGKPRPKKHQGLHFRGPRTKHQAYRDRLHAQGRCTRCARPAGRFYNCARCRAWRRRRYYRRYYRVVQPKLIAQRRTRALPDPIRETQEKAPVEEQILCQGTPRGICGFVLRTPDARRRGRCEECWAEVAA